MNSAHQQVLEKLESQEYRSNPFLAIDPVAKITEFASWFSGLGCAAIRHLPVEQRDTISYLLSKLQEDIKYIVSAQIDWNVSSLPFNNFDETTLQCESNDAHVQRTGVRSQEKGTKRLPDKKNSAVLTDVGKRSTFVRPPASINNFNFNIQYDPIVSELLYQNRIVKRAHSAADGNMYRVQMITKEAVCLLCLVVMGPYRSTGINTFNILQHTRSSKHGKLDKDRDAVGRLHHYHAYWLNQEVLYQIHQTHFLPGRSNTTFCVLCKETMPYTVVNQHILGAVHKRKFFKLFEKRDVIDMFLYTLQAALYGLPLLQTIQAGDVECDIALSHAKELVDGNLNSIIPLRLQDYVEDIKICENSRTVQCFTCKATLSDNISNVSSEIVTEHILFHTNTYEEEIDKEFTYLCDLCHKTFDAERTWQTHLRDLKILEDHQNKRQLIGELNEYECSSCRLIIYGDEISVFLHMYHAQGTSNRIEVPLPWRKTFSSADAIHRWCTEKVQEANTVHADIYVDNSWLVLQSIISGIYPKCQVYPFGSRVCGLAQKSSDLDVFVDIGDMYDGTKQQEPDEQKKIVKRVESQLRKYVPHVRRIIPIPHARTPIIKVHLVAADLDCDVSFCHGIAVEKTNFIRCCILMQPVLQPLVIFLKYWLHKCQLETQLTSYGLVLLSIFYMQQIKCLMPVEQLRQCSNVCTIDGWEIVKMNLSESQMAEMDFQHYNESISVLVKDWFKFYADFSYKTHIICPITGYPVHRDIFDEAHYHLRSTSSDYNDLLPFVQRYLKRVRDDQIELFANDTAMCVQDPFVLNINVTRSCSEPFVKKWAQACKVTYEYLQTLGPP